MVSTATKRRRQKRANQTAAAIVESKHEALAEKKALGVQVDAKAPDAALFQLDRGGESKSALKSKAAKEAHADRLLMRKARRGDAASRAQLQTRVRKSERFATANQDDSKMEGLSFPEGSQKKSQELGIVEKTILKKRTFDPDIHREKKKKDKERLKIKPGSHDLWMGDIKKEVDENTTDSRRHFVKCTTRRYRRAKAVIFPDAGSSINPSYEHHQDKLGHALAKIVAEEERERVIDEKLSFDPDLFKDDKNVDEVTGMNVDASGNNTTETKNNVEGDDEDLVPKSMPERKTKTQRNKERRKRELESSIAKKRRKEKVAADIEKIEELAEEAQEEADKLNGVTRRRRRKEHVPAPNRNRNRPVLFKIAGQRVRKEADNEHVALSGELADNLRSVQVANHNPLLKDRLLSFERRGMVESRKVLAKEVWRVRQEQRQDELRDKTKRKGKHSKSDISYWKEKSRKK